MERFEEYYNVDSDFVSELPLGWKILPNIAIFEERIERGNVKEELLAVTISKGIIRQSDLTSKKDISNEDKSAYKLVREGDLAYNKMRMWQGAVGYSPFRGIVSPAYVVLKPKMEINAKFFHYQFRSDFYIRYSKKASYGICDDQLNLRYKDFKRMYSVVPPIEVQNEIVKYLEGKEYELKKYLVKKRKQISVLRDQKVQVINNFIHTGLNPSSKEEVYGSYKFFLPLSWEFKPLKYLVKQISEQTDRIFTGQAYLALENIISNFGNHSYQFEDIFFESSVKKFKKGDVLFNKLRPYLAKVVVAQHDGVCVGELLVLRPKKEIMPQFLNYVLLSQRFIDFVNSSTYGTKMPRASWDFIGRIPVSFPKDIIEQQKIVDEIEVNLKACDKAINLIHNSMDASKRYFSNLVELLVLGRLKTKRGSLETV